MNIKQLTAHAKNIPQLDKGGLSIKNDLLEYIKDCPDNTSILDIGPFLGSTTAFIALGLIMHDKNIDIHSIDLWNACEEYTKRAKEKLGIDFIAGEDLMDRWGENLEIIYPYLKTYVYPYKMSINEYKHDQSEISLIVDDICCYKDRFDHLLQECSPYFIPGKTILFLCDYYFYETKDKLNFQYQKNMMEANQDVFKFIKRVPHSRCAIYRYLGGEIKYINEEVSHE
jgi:hypothetical protein